MDPSTLENLPRIRFHYTNHRGDRAIRTVSPIPGSLRYGTAEHHPEPTWLFDAWDWDRNAPRMFALVRIYGIFTG